MSSTNGAGARGVGVVVHDIRAGVRCARFAWWGPRRDGLVWPFTAMLVVLTLLLVGGVFPVPGLVGSARADDATMVRAWGADLYGEGRVPEAAEPALSIAAGAFHNVALSTDGRVVAWGDNRNGQTKVPDGLSDVIAVDAGTNHSLALKSDGTVVAWGSNTYWQTQVPNGLSDVTAIAAGGDHGLALRRDGTVVAWGSNAYGQASVPVGLENVTAISAGTMHSLALKSDGTVVSWGHRDGSTVPEGLTGVVAVAAGHEFSMALKADGDVVLFGRLDGVAHVGGAVIAAGGYHGTGATGWDYTRIGLILDSEGNIVWANNVTVPEDLGPVAAVAAGGKHVLALKNDGTLIAFGSDNDYGQAAVPQALGEVRAISAGWHHNLALMADGTASAWGLNDLGQTDVPEGLAEVTAVSAGRNFSLALKADGTVVGWGNPSVARPPDQLLSGGVTAISAGFSHSLALLADGTVVAWGWGTGIDVPAGLSGVVAVAAGNSSLALKDDGTVASWGGTNVPEGLVDVVAIAAGSGCLALTKEGTVVGWDGAEVPAGLTGITAIAAGDGSYMALRSDGTVIEWGSNSQGLPQGLAGVTAIATGGTHSLALATGTGGPPVLSLDVTAISTPRGGDSGNVTLTVYGTGFEDGALVKLARSGYDDIVGVTQNVISSTTGPAKVTTVLDLTGKPLGVWDVVVVNPDGASASLPGAFTLLEGGGTPRITVDIVGPSSVRVGSQATAYVIISNDGLNDVELTVELTQSLASGDFVPTNGFEASSRAIATESSSPTWGTLIEKVTVAVSEHLILEGVLKGCAVAPAAAEFIILAAVVYSAAEIGWELGEILFPARCVSSFDPNDIVGPGGYGEARFVREEILMPYTVFFENTAEATAPAQEVVVTDALDPAVFDLDSFMLREITFGSQSVVPPDGVNAFTTEVDLRPENNLIVRVEAGLDKTTGVAAWRFTSLDPETGELTEDPLAGFLPPNVTSPEGEGSVSYTVEPVEGLGTGTEIENTARIVFDANDPIDTPVWVNTLDTTDPVSEVAALPERQTTSFEVTWSGSDTGSGVRDYSVFVSEDGGPYTVWLANTTATSDTFTGTAGGSYRFFSSARDGAGNVEAYPSVPDTTTTARATQTVTWAPTTNLLTGDSPWTPDVAALSDGDGVISYAVTDAGTTGCTVDAASGVLSFDAAGSCEVTATAASTDAFEEGTSVVTFTIEPSLTVSGFFAPVDMDGVFNTVKGGSTVPLSFQVFRGDTEVTEVTVVDGFTVERIACPGATSTAGALEFTTTGGTALRYDDGKFIQNWKTPRTPGLCYAVNTTTVDGSSITANFLLK